jgi:EpsI family protein
MNKLAKPRPRVVVTGLAMLVAAAVAVGMKPTRMLAEERARLDLDAMIPSQFGDWGIDTSIVPVLPSPDVQAKLNSIYSQTLARTYVNSRGERIMLSIAYGGVQEEGLQTHVPEMCYPAQGFDVLKQEAGELASRFGDLAVKRLVASQGRRVEPITYWMTVGDQVVRVGWRWKLAQLRYGLTGVLPDGMLVRVSSIQADERAAYRAHHEFVDAMLGAIDQRDRTHFVGSQPIGPTPSEHTKR